MKPRGVLRHFFRATWLFALLFASQIRAQEPSSLTNGLIAHYLFNGSAIDISDSSFHGVMLGAIPSTDRFGRPDSALLFSDGGTTYVDAGAHEALQFKSDFTFSVWAKLAAANVDPRIISNGADFGYELLLTGESSALKPLVNIGGVRIQPTNTVPSTEWVFYAVRVSGSTLSIFLNGVHVHDGAVPQTPAYTGTLQFGRKSILDLGETRSYWFGQIDDIRFYNRALPDSAIEELFQWESVPRPEMPRIAAAMAQVVNGFIVGTAVVDGGSGYTNAPNIQFVGGQGTGARAEASVVNGRVVSIAILDPGKGYATETSVIIGAPPYPPRAAAASSTVVNGFVVSATITDGGFGYDQPPTVLLIGGGGSGATAEAKVQDGRVIGLIITSPGSGYLSAPKVKIASPPFSPGLSIAVSRVKVFLKLLLGRTYQLESSSDMRTWRPQGDPFMADEESIEKEFEVTNTGQFFRINQVR